MPRGAGLRMLAALGAARALVLPQRIARSLTRRAATETERGAPKLPKGQFRPKQSLGQNYLQDPNYAVQLGVSYLTSLGVCGGFTPSTRVVSRNDGSGWFLCRF